MNAFKTSLFAVCVIALTVCSVQLIQAHQAIDAWQAEVERLNGEVARLEAEIARLEAQTESDFYRGVVAACTGIGVAMEVPGPLVSQRCSALMHTAYEADWFDKLHPDSWTWPPVKKSQAPSEGASGAP